MADLIQLLDPRTAHGLAMAGAAVSGLLAMAVSAMPEGYRPPIEEIDWEGFKARIRAEHSVRLITEEEGGEPHTTVGNGIYGYTYSLSFDNPVPMFPKGGFQSFELHKLGNGERAVLGCVTKQVAETLTSGEFVALRLYPEPYDDAVAPIVLNYKHILRSNNRSARDKGNYIEFDVKVTG